MKTAEELDEFWINLSKDLRENKKSHFENLRKNKPWEWQYKCCFYDLLEQLSSMIVGLATNIVYTEYSKNRQFWSVDERKKFILKQKEKTKNSIGENDFNSIDYSNFPYFLEDENRLEWISVKFYNYKRNFVAVRKFVKNNDFEKEFPRKAFYEFTNGLDSVNDFYNLFADLNILKLSTLWEMELEDNFENNTKTTKEYPLVFENNYCRDLFIECIKAQGKAKATLTKFHEIFQRGNYIRDDVDDNRHFYKFVKNEFNVPMKRLEPFASKIKAEKGTFTKQEKKFLKSNNLDGLI